MIKLTKKLLNENKIYNSHGIAELTGKNPCIFYHSATYGRGSMSAKWQVAHMGYQTDPNGAWYNHGNKTFLVFPYCEKEQQFEKAKAWVKERYGLDITERDVWGNWHVTGTMDKLREIISKRSK